MAPNFSQNRGFEMRFLFGLILAFAVVIASADNLGVSGVKKWANGAVYALTDNTIDVTYGRDSLAIGGHNIYGPIAVKLANGLDADYFSVLARAGVVASGDTAAVQYQGTASPWLVDTCSTWITIDSLFSGGTKGGRDVAVGTKAFNYIWIRILATDATAVELQKRIAIVLK